MNPKLRVGLAWTLLVVSVVGWPVTAIFFSKYIQQVILGLSWIALIISALGVLATTDVRKQQEEET